MDSFVILTAVVFVVAIWNTSVGPAGAISFVTMATLLPPPAVVPIHATVEAIAGVSRTLFLRRSVNWRFVASFCLFGLVGFSIGAPILNYSPLNNDMLRIILGSAILVTVWVPIDRLFSSLAPWMAAGGFSTAFITLFIGATGSLVSALVQKRHPDHGKMLATSAACMVFQHGGKILIFGLLGFSFSLHAGLLASMIAASIAGTWFGRGVSIYVSERITRPIFKAIVTIMALNLLWTGIA